MSEKLRGFYSTIGKGNELANLKRLIPVLHDYARGKGILPRDIALYAATYLEQYAHEKWEKTRSDSPFLVSLKIDAVRYVVFCQQKRIRDARFRKTVAKAYGLKYDSDKKTSVLDTWVRKYKQLVEDEFDSKLPDAEAVEKIMFASGQQYQKHKPSGAGNRS